MFLFGPSMLKPVNFSPSLGVVISKINIVAVTVIRIINMIIINLSARTSVD